jgi:hypothetical protein
MAIGVVNPITYARQQYKDWCRSRRVTKMHQEAEKLENETEKLLKELSTDLIEVYDTHLLLNKTTYVRCIIGGATDEDVSGIPPGMTEKAHERIMSLANDGARIEICTGIIKIPRRVMNEELDDDYRNNDVDLNNENEHAGGSLKKVKLVKEKRDMEKIYTAISENSFNTFAVSYIITIMGERNEVAQTEAQVIGVLNSEVIEFHTPFDCMLQAFLVSRPYPKSDRMFQIRVDSETAAIMCPTTSINSTLDDEGIWFGYDRKTGMPVLINEQAMAARHRKYFGATGSGKSFTTALHLFRAITFYDCRGCVITPKHEKENFIALANYFGKRGKVIYVSDTGDAIPVLQMVIDEQSMGNSPETYRRAYFRHIRTIKAFFNTWFNERLSDFANGYLEDKLIQVYDSAGIDRNKPETWKNAKWPKLEKLKLFCDLDADDESLSPQTKAVAESLSRKLSSIGPKGTHSYLNRDVEDIDYSNIDMLVFDVSGVDDEIRDAMYVLIAGIMGNRYQTDLEKDTIMVVDEARVFLRTPFLNSYIKDGVALGRSYGVWWWLITQNPADFAKANADEEFKMNIPISVIMGHDINKSNIDQVKKYFNFNDSEIEDLAGCEQGDCVLVVRGENYPLRCKPTPFEYATLKGLDLNSVVMPMLSSDGYTIKPEYKSMVEQHHIIFKQMIEGNASNLRKEGWVNRSRLPTIRGRGSCSIWYKKGEIVGDDVNIEGFGKMTLEHLLGVAESELYLKDHGIKTAVHHNNDVDMEFWINGEPYGFEWERAHSHTVEQLLEKKGKMLVKYKDFRFACSNSPDEYEVISKAVTPQYTVPRGTAIIEWFDGLIAKQYSTDAKIKQGSSEEPEIKLESKSEEGIESQANNTETKETFTDIVFDGQNIPEIYLKRLPAFVWEEIFPKLPQEKKEAILADIKQKTESGYYDEQDAELERMKSVIEQEENQELSENEMVSDGQEAI